MVKRKVAENNRGFKGVWIPKEIWLDEELTIQEMVFLVEIDSLDQENGCYASNAHFADFFGLSKSRSSAVIKTLEEKGYIAIKYIYEGKEIKKRIIHVVTKYRGRQETEEGYLGNAQGSNTSLSNTSNNNSEGKPSQTYSISNILDLMKVTDDNQTKRTFIRFANKYKEAKGVGHPKLKIEQLNRVANTLENISSHHGLSEEDWNNLVDRYFETTNSDCNINHFAYGNELQGTIRGMLDNREA